MKFKFLNYFCYFIFFLFIVSCSNEKLTKMGFVKTKTNQFSVSRKSPLEMPPDMYLRPPKLEKIQNSGNLSNEEASLDDILANTNTAKENKNKKSLRDKRILQKILNADATNLK